MSTVMFQNRMTRAAALLLLPALAAVPAAERVTAAESTSAPAAARPAAPASAVLDALLDRLKSQDAKAADAAARELAALGRPAAAGLVRTLADPDNAARARAAGALRDVLASDPGARPNDHGRAYWEDRARQTRPGMKTAQVLEFLPPNPPVKNPGELPGLGSGDSHNCFYWLDDYWSVSLAFRNSDSLIATPAFTEAAKSVWVAPPANYTGDWVTWLVNGRKANEIQYRNGVYHGTFTSYFDNGNRNVEQHYVNGHANGPDTGWYPNGKKAYEGQYENDHQVGTWTHWYEDGNPKHISTYRAGKLNGASTTFFPGGRKQYEVNYTNGLQDGTDTAWDETGKVLWARLFEMGKMVEQTK